MRRIAFLLIVVTLLPPLFGCVDKSEYALLCDIVEKANSEEKYNSSFQLSIINLETERNTCFTQGKINVDKTDGLKMDGAMTQYVLGEYSNANIAFVDNEYYTEVGDSRVIVDMSEKELENQFIFGDTPIFDVKTVKNLKVTTDGIQRTYKFECNPPRQQLNLLTGADIYSLAGVLNPDYTMTEYKDVECTYIVTEGTGKEDMVLVTRFMKFTMYMYSQMPYVPGEKPDKDDYLTRIEVTCQITYNAFGDSVTVELPDRADYKKAGE